MLIDELPDDCLLLIFKHIKELDFLMWIYCVSNRWARVMTMRLRNERWLIRQFEEPIPKCVFVFTGKRLAVTDLAPLMPKLRILDIGYPFYRKLETNEMIKLLSELQHLRGLIHMPSYYPVPITQYVRNLEMITTDTLEPYLFERGPYIKQLYVKDHNLNAVTYHAHRFPNLLRLHIEHNIGPDEQSYTGPDMPSLQILEFRSYPDNKCSMFTQFIGFQCIDKCPNLKSAHLSMATTRQIIDKTKIHPNLENLVVDFNYRYEYVRVKNPWNKLAGLFAKYPNLKNLALRFNGDIKNHNLPVLLRILPRLEVLDMSGATGITPASVEIVRSYCERNNRTVAFYYVPYGEQIKLDHPHWVSIFQRVAENLDFMKNCFLKQYWFLPHLMDPMDDVNP